MTKIREFKKTIVLFSMILIALVIVAYSGDFNEFGLENTIAENTLYENTTYTLE